MHITAEILPRRREESVDLEPNATGMDLLRALHLPAEAHILVRDDTPIPADAALADGDRIRVIGVVSGGSVT